MSKGSTGAAEMPPRQPRPYRVRAATPEDAPFLPAIERSAGEVFRTLPDLAWIADDAVQSEACHRALIAGGGGFVAEDRDGVLIGFVNGAPLGAGYHIHELAVAWGRQGTGVGRALIEAMRVFASRQGYARMSLTTFRDVPWNAPFYERLGFAVLDAGRLPPELQQLLDREEEVGFPRERRCAMAHMLP